MVLLSSLTYFILFINKPSIMQKILRTYLSTAKVQMSCFLFIIAITAFFKYHSLEAAKTLLVAVSTTVLFDLLLIKLRKITFFFPSASLVSGLIIGLLVSPKLPLYEVGLTSAIAMLGKNFLRINNRHIFNPASFGLFIVSFVFTHNVSWWGASFQIASANFLSLFIFFILLTPGYISMIRMKRYRITISFFITYILLFGIFQFSHHLFNMPSIIRTIILDPTTLFFSLVMLPEPMTSPNNHTRQLLFGFSVAFFAALSSFLSLLSLPDPFIFGLLINNFLFFKFR